MIGYEEHWADEVSVPIRGLFNLTEKSEKSQSTEKPKTSFRPHQGII